MLRLSVEYSTDKRNINNLIPVAVGFSFLKLVFFLPEDGTRLPKKFWDTPSLYVLIKTAFIWLINGVLW